jgi:hypothetical protein
VGPSNGTEVTSPIYPRRGAINVGQLPVLRWEVVPLASYYDVWVWRAETPPTPPTLVESRSAVETTVLTVLSQLEDGVEHLWRVDTGLPGTLIPGREWAFTTRPLPDLVPTTVTAPVSVLTGDTLSITWTYVSRLYHVACRCPDSLSRLVAVWSCLQAFNVVVLRVSSSFCIFCE